MKRVRVEKMARDFGVLADWYNHENVAAVEAADPRRYCGGRMFPAAYFVVVEENVYDPMRDFNPHYWAAVEYVGPFADEEAANGYAKANC